VLSCTQSFRRSQACFSKHSVEFLLAEFSRSASLTHPLVDHRQGAMGVRFSAPPRTWKLRPRRVDHVCKVSSLAPLPMSAVCSNEPRGSFERSLSRVSSFFVRAEDCRNPRQCYVLVLSICARLCAVHRDRRACSWRRHGARRTLCGNEHMRKEPSTLKQECDGREVPAAEEPRPAHTDRDSTIRCGQLRPHQGPALPRATLSNSIGALFGRLRPCSSVA